MAVAGGCGADRNASGADHAPSVASTSVQVASLPLLPGSFAYVDSGGTEVLALAPVPDPSAIRGAVCSNARQFQVCHERVQKEQEGSSHRQISSNFRKVKGDVIRLLAGEATPDETCLLATDSVLLRSAGTVQPVPDPTCREQHAGTLAHIAGREVVQCWRLALVSWGAELHAAQFQDIWRVEDQGVFSPDAFGV